MTDPGKSADTAKLWLANAYGFWLAAKRIADSGVGTDFPWPPFFATVGYTFELSLKAYVIHHGGTEHLCRTVIRHDLNRATVEACARGLVRPSEPVMALIAKIGPYHKTHSFRYMTPINVAALPNVVETLAATNHHMISVADQLRELLS